MEVVRLRDLEQQEVLKSLPSNQAKRLVTYLSQNPNAKSADVSKYCQLSNISDVARRVNAITFDRNLFISCQRPLITSNAAPGAFLWGIYRLPKVAVNDSQGVNHGNQ